LVGFDEARYAGIFNSLQPEVEILRLSNPDSRRQRFAQVAQRRLPVRRERFVAFGQARKNRQVPAPGDEA
jgi:hypothetical protein